MQTPSQIQDFAIERLQVPEPGLSQLRPSPTALSDDAWTTVNPSPVALEPGPQNFDGERDEQAPHLSGDPGFTICQPASLERTINEITSVPEAKTPAACGHDHQIEMIKDQALQLSRRNEQLRPLRNQVLRLRSTTGYQRHNSQHYERFLRESQRNFMEELQQVASLIPAGPAFHRLRVLYSQAVADQIAVDERSETWRKWNSEISHVEYDLFKGEDRLSKEVGKLLEILGDLTAQRLLASRSVSEAGSAIPSPSVQRLSPEPMPEIVASFLSKMAVVRNMHERIQSLAEDHDEDLARAELEEEQGREISRPRDGLQRDFEQAYNLACKNLADAVKEANLATEACEKEGYDPQEYIRVVDEPSFTMDEAIPTATSPNFSPATPSTLALDKPEYTTDMIPFFSIQRGDESSDIRHVISGPLDADVLLPPREGSSNQKFIDRVTDWVGKVDGPMPAPVDPNYHHSEDRNPESSSDVTPHLNSGDQTDVAEPPMAD